MMFISSGETIGLLREIFQAEWFLKTAITIGPRDHAI